jgi:hypothetical protein
VVLVLCVWPAGGTPPSPSHPKQCMTLLAGTHQCVSQPLLRRHPCSVQGLGQQRHQAHSWTRCCLHHVAQQVDLCLLLWEVQLQGVGWVGVRGGVGQLVVGRWRARVQGDHWCCEWCAQTEPIAVEQWVSNSFH